MEVLANNFWIWFSSMYNFLSTFKIFNDFTFIDISIFTIIVIIVIKLFNNKKE